jgi:hypothetical protein
MTSSWDHILNENHYETRNNITLGPQNFTIVICTLKQILLQKEQNMVMLLLNY